MENISLTKAQSHIFHGKSNYKKYNNRIERVLLLYSLTFLKSKIKFLIFRAPFIRCLHGIFLVNLSIYKAYDSREM